MYLSEVKPFQQTHTQPGVGPQSLQLALQFSGQVCAAKLIPIASKLTADQVADNLPRIGDQQAHHVAAFEPGVEEVLK